MTHACYADDTVVFCKSDFRNITALERVLNDFEMASGNEIKRAKSYIIWLGSKRGSTDRIANIPPLIGSERYLGLMIAENFDPDINWKKIIDNLPACVEHWSTFGLSTYGRTLMLNSSLLSKLWFIAPHVPADKKTRDKIIKLSNKYFRKNKKITAVDYYRFSF